MKAWSIFDSNFIWLGWDGAISTLQSVRLQGHHHNIFGGHHQDPTGYGEPLGGLLAGDKTCDVKR